MVMCVQASREPHERGGSAPAAGRRHARRAQAVAAGQAGVPLHAPPGTLLYARSDIFAVSLLIVFRLLHWTPARLFRMRSLKKLQFAIAKELKPQQNIWI